MKPARSHNSTWDTRGYVARMIASASAGVVLAGIVAVITDHVPLLVAALLNIPGAIYCYVDGLVETPPVDDVPLWEFGREASCYFVGIALNIPFYTLLVFGGLSLRARANRRVNGARA